jgi:hypothetical protein
MRAVVGAATLGFPLVMTFRLFTLAGNCTITDAAARPLLFVKAKAVSFKADVMIYRDEAQTDLAYRIRGDRMVGSVRYLISTADGRTIGALQRKAVSSLWRATYPILDANDQQVGVIHEVNPWVKVLDGLVGDIPIAGLVLQMFINPSYVVEYPVGTPSLLLRKRRSLVERRFIIEEQAPLDARALDLVLPAVVMFAHEERRRG